MSQLRGSDRLADELFLLVHDDVSGKPRLHPRGTGIALSGALLSELVFHRRIEVGPGPEPHAEVVTLVDRRPVGDELADSLLAHLAAHGHVRPLPAWLRHLGQAATHNVAERLVVAGLVTPVRSRLPRREERWVPVDSPTAAWPATRLRMLLSKQEQVSLSDAVLAGFAVHCGLSQRILWDTPAESRQYLDYLLASLPGGLRALLARTESTVVNAVMNRPI